MTATDAVGSQLKQTKRRGELRGWDASLRLMIHPVIERYASLLVNYCTEVQPGESVLLQVDTAAHGMARALSRAVLQAGGEPHLRLSYPQQYADMLELATEPMLATPPELQLEEMKRVAAFIRVSAPQDTRGLQLVDKSRISAFQKRLQSVQQERLQNTRWAVSIYPTYSGAIEADMSLDDYQRFVYGAMFLFDDDPAARWRQLGAKQQELVERLNKASEVHIEGPGTDLRLSVRGRTWINSDGKRNMPSGEVFTSPIEDSAEGTISFTVPSALHGAVVEGVRLTFEGGKVVAAQAERGQDLLDAQLASDDGARYLGELGIGTNPHITRPVLHTLFDEKILGTVHLALGRSYTETGGKNDSAIHWDLICDLRDQGRVLVDGEPFLENGRLPV